MSNFILIAIAAVIVYVLYRVAAKFITWVVNKYHSTKLQKSLDYLVAVGTLSRTIEVDENTGQYAARYCVVDQQFMLKTKPNIGFIREQ
jgi:hypothetical protein